jgi:hypothetical protein
VIQKRNKPSAKLSERTFSKAEAPTTYGIVFLLLALASTAQWGEAVPETFNRRIPVLSTIAQMQVPPSAGIMPGTVPIFADLDGDARWDFVAVHLSGYDYKIAVVLSSRAGVALLTPPARLGVITVHVCDVNGDHVQDILVQSPAAPYPVAVWLGRGNGTFEAVDRELLPDDRTAVDSTASRNGHRSVDPDILLDPSYPVCEKADVRIGLADLNPSGFIIGACDSAQLRRECCGLAPRSPPSISAA